jgi:hypothetical protein
MSWPTSGCLRVKSKFRNDIIRSFERRSGIWMKVRENLDEREVMLVIDTTRRQKRNLNSK